MNSRQSLKGAYLLVGAKGLAASIGLISTLVLARLLHPEDYGLVVLVDAVVTLLAAMTELQMASVLTHLPKVTDAHLCTAWTLNALRATALAALVWASAPLLAWFYGKPELESIAWAMSLSVFLGSLQSPRMAMLARELNFKSEFILTLSQKLVGFAVTLVAALYWRNYWALVAGTVATQACALVMSYWCAPFRPRITLVKLKDLWGYSMWLTASMFVKTLNARMDQFTVGKLFSTHTTGVYSLAGRLSSVLFTETLAAALKVISPSLVPLQNQRTALAKAYLNSLALVCCLFLPMATIASALSEPVIAIALGPKWNDVTDVFRVLVMVACLESLGTVGLSVVLATLNTRLAFHRDLLSLCARLLSMSAGYALGGFTGLLWGRAACALVDCLLYFRIAGQVTGLSLSQQTLSTWRTLTACVLTYATVAGGQLSPLAVPPGGAMSSVLGLVAWGVAGLILHGAVQWLIWVFAGRPDGPERAIAHYLRALINRSSSGQSA
ncbi:MAG: lipopolysaccharide biosynthesis protein [Limnobacter sp.]|uniref:lipopolysaccharide biosynthesis protein n=1 Tax=Limnobacter sp. TaxID=2003368 RepID=UPI003918A5C2